MAISEITVAATATVLFAISTDDRAWIVLDNQGSQTVFIGDAATVTTSNGIALDAGDKVTLDFAEVKAKTSNNLAMWGIVASSTASVRVWEVNI